MRHGRAPSKRKEDAFYGSEEWHKGLRDAVLADIESYTTIVVRLDPATIHGLRESLAPPGDKRIEPAQRVPSSDLHAQGSFVDKQTFLQLAARPATVTNLKANAVEVQLLGDVAIVHARTTFITPDGQPGSGRYTDVWARRDGRWLTVSAHVTRR